MVGLAVGDLGVGNLDWREEERGGRGEGRGGRGEDMMVVRRGLNRIAT